MLFWRVEPRCSPAASCVPPKIEEFPKEDREQGGADSRSSDGQFRGTRDGASGQRVALPFLFESELVEWESALL